MTSANWIATKIAAQIHAGIFIGITKSTSVQIPTRGNSTRYAPMSAAIAPEAPMITAVLEGWENAWASPANAPQITKNGTKRIRPSRSSMLAPKTQSISMLPSRCHQLACRNRLVITVRTRLCRWLSPWQVSGAPGFAALSVGIAASGPCTTSAGIMPHVHSNACELPAVPLVGRLCW